MASKRQPLPRSRFTEGSMNDRVSAVPPPHFLGPERPRQQRKPSSSSSSSAVSSAESANSVPTDFNFGFAGSGNSQAQQHESDNRPRSASAYVPAPKEKKGGFFAPLWSGLWEKLNIGKKQPRPLSLDAGTAAAASAARASGRHPQPAQPININGVSIPGGVGRDRPTKEEVMASYHQLLDSGFFGAHAIKSTRHPGTSTQAVASEALLSTSLPTQRASGPHADFAPSSFTKPQLPTIYSPPRHMPPPSHESSPTRKTRQTAAPGTPERPTTVPATPDSRGKKRRAAQEEDEEIARPTRKLRKTTRSIADLAIPRIRRNRAAEPSSTSSQPTHPPPPPPAPMRPFATASPRSHNAAGFGLSAAVDPQPLVKSVGGVLTRRSFSGSSQTNKLAKRPTSSSGGNSRPGSSRGLHISGPVSPVVRLGPGQFDALQSGQVSDVESLGGKVISAGVPWGKLAQQQELAAAVQSQTQNEALQGRRRNGPLSVRPNANRGIPCVPAIPAQYKSGRGVMERERGENEDVVMTFYVED